MRIHQLHQYLQTLSLTTTISSRHTKVHSNLTNLPTYHVPERLAPKVEQAQQQYTRHESASTPLQRVLVKHITDVA